MNIELMKQKEELFAEYRHKIEEYESTQKQVNDFNAVLQKCHNQMDKLEREIGSMRKFIDYMIRNDLDPVSAKLKYSEDREDREVIDKTFKASIFHHSVYSTSGPVGPVYTPTASSWAGANGGTGGYPGIIAQTFDDVYEDSTDSNKLDCNWLDH